MTSSSQEQSFVYEEVQKMLQKGAITEVSPIEAHPGSLTLKRLFRTQ